MADVECIFYIRDNKLTTVSGADAGDYAISDNHANILISAVEYQIKSFDGAYCKVDTLGQIITTVTEAA